MLLFEGKVRRLVRCSGEESQLRPGCTTLMLPGGFRGVQEKLIVRQKDKRDASAYFIFLMAI